MKRYIVPLIIIALAGLLRFAYLGDIPNAIHGDELHYALTAKSVWLTGRDATGAWNPWSLLWFRYPPHEEQAELPYILHLFTSAPFPFSMVLFKLSFAILGVGVVMLLWLIAKQLFGDAIGVCVGVVAAVNPWLVVMSRTGYEAIPATFFYLLALYLMLKKKSAGILWAAVPLILGFYSYIATKVILVLFTSCASLLAYVTHKKRYGNVFLILIGISVIVSLIYFILIKTDPAITRLNDLFLPNSPIVSSQVNEMRHTSIQSPILPILTNKYTVYAQLLTAKIFRIFSPTYLFADGDLFFLPATQSFFYYIDALFIVLGSLFLFSRYRKETLIILLFAGIGIIPHLLNTTMGDFSIHLSLMFPFLIILAGAGISGIILAVPKKFTTYTAALVIILYAANVASFVNVYFFQYPLAGSSTLPTRILSSYIRRSANNKKITVYTPHTQDTFHQYIFYENQITKNHTSGIGTQMFSPNVTVGNINITGCDTLYTPSGNTTAIFDVECNKPIEGTRSAIALLKDGGEVYKILGDTLCNHYALGRYPTGITVGDFDIEHLSNQRFCETFISTR